MNYLPKMKEFEAWVASHEDDILSLLQDFARIRSVSRADLAAEGAPFGAECREMLDYALHRAQEMGFKTEDHQGYCGSAVWGDGENAIGILSHLDVVPEGDHKEWLFPPFGATRSGDFLIGRGVDDNKAAAVMGLFAAKMLEATGNPLKHGLRVVFGLSEETGMQDMAHFVKNVTVPKLSFVPDAGFPVNYAQKGSIGGQVVIPAGCEIKCFEGGEVRNMVPPHARALVSIDPAALASALAGSADLSVVANDDGLAEVKAIGVASHAASPEHGKSAIHALAAELAATGLFTGESRKALEAIAELTGDDYGDNVGIACEDPDSGRTTIVYGAAKTEDGRIHLSVDSRTSVAADIEANKAAFTAAVNERGFSVDRLDSSAPVYMPKDDPRVTELQDLFCQITGIDCEPYTMGGGTYSRVIPNAITFGLGIPGDEKARPADLPAGHGGAHAPDEFLYIPGYLKAIALYGCALLCADQLID